MFADVNADGGLQRSSVMQLDSNGGLGLQLFHVLVACSGKYCRICGTHEAGFTIWGLPIDGRTWAAGMQSLQGSGNEGSSNNLTGLNWSIGESVRADMCLSCSFCSSGMGETNHIGSLTAGHMELGLGGGCILTVS